MKHLWMLPGRTEHSLRLPPLTPVQTQSQYLHTWLFWVVWGLYAYWLGDCRMVVHIVATGSSTLRNPLVISESPQGMPPRCWQGGCWLQATMGYTLLSLLLQPLWSLCIPWGRSLPVLRTPMSVPIGPTLDAPKASNPWGSIFLPVKISCECK